MKNNGIRRIFNGVFVTGIIFILAYMVLADFSSPTVVNPLSDTNQTGSVVFNTTVTVNGAGNTANATNATYFFFNASSGVLIYNISTVSDNQDFNNTFNVTINTKTFLPDGTYNLTVNITNGSVGDIVENSSITNIQFDNNAPRITINSPVNGTYYSSGTDTFVFNVTIIETGTGLDTVNLSNGTGKIGTETQTGNDWTVTVNISNLTDGTNVLRPVANDTVGNLNISETITVILDTTAPTVNLVSPINFTWTIDTTPNFVFNFTDNTSPNATCNVVVDGSTLITNASTINNSLTTMTGSALALGQHNWTVDCTDYAGNFGNASANSTFDVVAKPAISSPLNSTFTNSTALNFTTSFTSYSFGLDKAQYNVSCELYITNTSSILATHGSNASSISGSNTQIENTVAVGDGLSTWYTNCTFNNTDLTTFAPVDIVSDTYTFTTDTQTPDVDLVTPLNWTWTDDTTPIFKFNFTDNSSATATCDVVVDGATVATNATSKNNTLTVISPTTALSAGLHNWTVNCSDGGENIAMADVNNTFEIVTVSATPADETYTTETRPDNVTFSFSFDSAIIRHADTSTNTASCELFIANSSNYVAHGVNETVENATSTVIRNNQSLISGAIGPNANDWTINCTWNGSQITANNNDNYTLFVDNITSTVTAAASDVTASAATLTATTNENADCRYGTVDAFGSMTAFTTTGGISHSGVTVSGLSASTSYTYYVRCRDDSLNEGSGSAAFTTSDSGGSAGGGGSSGSSGVARPGKFAKETWTSIFAGESATVPVANGEIGVTQLKFKVSKDTYGAWVKVEKVEALPSSVGTPSDTVYKNIRITENNIQKVLDGTVSIEFKVTKQWLADNGLGKDNVAMFRHVDDKWVELPTTTGRDDGTYVHYTADTPGFSYFVIAKGSSEVTAPLTQDEVDAGAPEAEPAKEPAVQEPADVEPETTKSSAPIVIGVILGLVAILAVAWFLTKKK